MIQSQAYHSVYNIRKLANDIIKYTAKFNFDRYVRLKKFDKIVGFDIELLKNNNYGVLDKHIKESNITVEFTPYAESDSKTRKAAYTYYKPLDDDSFDPTTHRVITIMYDKHVVYDQIKSMDKFNVNNLYLVFHEYFFDNLTHELLHFYDDFRTQGLAFNDKSKPLKIQPDSEENISKIKKIKGLRYNKLPYEVWARFTQAYNITKFYDTKTVGGKTVYVMKDMNTVIKEFVKNLKRYNILGDKMKRKVIRKIAQFWYYEEDKIHYKNTGKFKYGLFKPSNT